MRQPGLGDFDDDDRTDEFQLVGDERADAYGHSDRRLPRLLVSILAMALFAGGLWLAYHLGARHAGSSSGGGGVPLIRADQQPDKVKPDLPGGMNIPDQNVSIFDEKPGAAAPVEKLLPPPETPMPRPEPPPPAPPAPAAINQPQPAPPQPPTAAPGAAPLPSSPGAEEPASPPASSVAPTPGMPPPAAETAPAASPRMGKAGGVQVRLASVRTPDAARAEWQRLKHDNADLLGRLTAVAVRTDLGDKGIYYRIEAGPLDSAAAAERLCDALKRRNLGCILAR